MKEGTKRDTATKPILNPHLSFPTHEAGQVRSKFGSPRPLLFPSSERAPESGLWEGGRTPANCNSLLLTSCTYPTPR